MKLLPRKTMSVKMTNVDSRDIHNKKMSRKKPKLFIALIILLNLPFLLLQFALISCQSQSDGEINTASELSTLQKEDNPLYFFDYTKIRLEDTSSIGIKMENCNLYVDIYGDLVILGEVKNISPTCKTDIEITFDFYNKNGEKIVSDAVPTYINYLRGGSSVPFSFYLSEKENYIDICKVKIGVNYKNYYEKFKGNLVVKIEKFYYQGDILVIEGKVLNLSRISVEDLKLLCTFYNKKDRVVFIKQCYLPREKIGPLEEQSFILKVLLDEYLTSFTHYSVEIFFEDSLI